jgi:hypothetical protein
MAFSWTPRAKVAAAVGAVVVVGAGVGIGVAVSGGNGSGTPKLTATAGPSTPAPKPPALNPLTGEGRGGHVFAVKIDNVNEAQYQHAGLNSADVVYVIQVEGGLSRYLAVFDSVNAPQRVGPVRSARQSDIPLLAAYGRVGLVYSGAISGLKPDLAAANLQTINPDNSGQLFGTYPNLAVTQNVGFVFGAEPAGGAPASTASASMPAASFSFTASGAKWLVSVDGHADNTVDAGQANANNVIIQHVNVVQGKYTDYNSGSAANEVFSVTTGSGNADFYRDGRVWHGHWSKASDTAPTSYTVGGEPMRLAPGRTWIVLVANTPFVG